MSKIVTVEQMRAIESAADAEGVSYDTMMERAGRAVAERVKYLIEDIESPRIAVLAGKGNNGGDGLVAAYFLKQETEAIVTVFVTEPRQEGDPKVTALQEAGVLIADGKTDAEQGYRVLKTMVANADVVIDAILGTGAKLPIKGDLEKILRQVHKALKDRESEHPAPVYSTPIDPSEALSAGPIILAVDIPTGLNADTGELDPDAIHAHETLTFEAAKPGLLTFPGAEAVGLLHVVPLGLPEKLKPLADVKYTLVDSAVVRDLIPTRAEDANKGTFGKVMIAAGSINYTGAPALAATAAYRVGAGLVTVAAPQPIIPMIGAHLVEATWLVMPHDMGVISKGAARVLREGLDGYSALLIGPGLAQETATAEFIEALFQKETAKAKPRSFGFAPAVTIAEGDKKDDEIKPLPPMVVDADGLNLLAKVENWWTRLPARTILTPHAGEMARLCGIEDDEAAKGAEKVQMNRVNLAAEKAAEWNMVVVLKGAHTVVADPDGRVAILPFANSALAKAGTGDVLAGIIVGLLGQKLDAFDAAVAGAYIQGLAGDIAIDYAGSKASVLASEVVDSIGDALEAIAGYGA